MASKRVMAMILAWLLMSQPVLSAALTDITAHGDHNHSSGHHHDHHGTEVGAHHDHHEEKGHHHEDGHQDHQHAYPSPVKASTHDCGPCVNGDMNHCQCGAVVHASEFSTFRNYAFFPSKLLYTHILAAHRQSLFRPPIFA